MGLVRPSPADQHSIFPLDYCCYHDGHMRGTQIGRYHAAW
jgi:hypothetical protein